MPSLDSYRAATQGQNFFGKRFRKIVCHRNMKNQFKRMQKVIFWHFKDGQKLIFPTFALFFHCTRILHFVWFHDIVFAIFSILCDFTKKNFLHQFSIFFQNDDPLCIVLVVLYSLVSGTEMLEDEQSCEMRKSFAAAYFPAAAATAAFWTWSKLRACGGGGLFGTLQYK